jgi:hypothetical protein
LRKVKVVELGETHHHASVKLELSSEVVPDGIACG